MDVGRNRGNSTAQEGLFLLTRSRGAHGNLAWQLGKSKLTQPSTRGRRPSSLCMQKGDIFTAIFACGAASDTPWMGLQLGGGGSGKALRIAVYLRRNLSRIAPPPAQKMRKEEAAGAPFENSLKYIRIDVK